MLFLAFAVPLLLYLPFLSSKFCFGDGPELLTAILTLGGAHPSGYPLYTLLGQLPARLPWSTPNFNVTLFLSTIPTAVSCSLIYSILRRLKVDSSWAWLAGVTFALSPAVLHVAVKVEVYGLACLLEALTIYGLVRFSQESEGLKWGYLTVLFASLGMTNHLTSSFLAVGAGVGLVAMRPRQVLRPRTLLVMSGIALGCALVYLYVPWQAFANRGDRISWNDPRTLKRFWFHVTGAEYNVFRSTGNVREHLAVWSRALRNEFFPGFCWIGLFGLFVGFARHWKVTLPLTLFLGLFLGYLSVFSTNDISEYYPEGYLCIVLFAALGFDRLVTAGLFRVTGESRWIRLVLALAAVGWLGWSCWQNRGERYDQGFAEDISRQVARALPERAILLTGLTSYTFSMWYEAYVRQPDRELVVLDPGMFSLGTMEWYRETLRRRHPQVQWPSDGEVSDPNQNWLALLLERNQDRYRSFILPFQRPQILGWKDVICGMHHELVADPEGQGGALASRVARHIYTAKHVRVRNRNYFYDSEQSYPVGSKVACVVEWWPDREEDQRAQWVFHGPGGPDYRPPARAIASTAATSWDFLPAHLQTPGSWTCEVELREGEPPLQTSFWIR